MMAPTQLVDSTSPIRPLSLARDLPQVIRLLNRVFSPTLDAEGRRALNSMNNRSALLARLSGISTKIAPGFVWDHHGRIIGNVSLIPTRIAGRVIVANVAVDEQFRRRGIGRALMVAALDHLSGRGVDRVLLQVDVDNLSAKRLYQELGFHNLGSTTLWYVSPGMLRTVPPGGSYDIRPLRSTDYREAFDLDTHSFPQALNWPEPIGPDLYRRGFFKRLDWFMNGKSAETWQITIDGALAGLGSIWSEWSRPHRLTIRVAPEYRSELTQPLLAKLLRRLNYMRRRHISIEHLCDDRWMDNLLQAANFTPKRRLSTMMLNLKQNNL